MDKAFLCGRKEWRFDSSRAHLVDNKFKQLDNITMKEKDKQIIAGVSALPIIMIVLSFIVAIAICCMSVIAGFVLTS